MSGAGRGSGGGGGELGVETGVTNLLLPTELLVAVPTPSLPVVSTQSCQKSSSESSE